VITPHQVAEVTNAGATFVISPNRDREVIQATKDAGAVSIPGAFTPSEILEARRWGADVVKVFPLQPLGIGYLRQIREPLNDVPMLVSGGVTAELARDSLHLGCVSVGVGVGLLDRDAVERQDWAALADAARSYLARVAEPAVGA
jgi:2-dehydro-3-deoxyphosphogluconate aldolase/(4S)-4-hydroxy-2-oxoglutarate aldolase